MSRAVSSCTVPRGSDAARATRSFTTGSFKYFVARTATPRALRSESTSPKRHLTSRRGAEARDAEEIVPLDGTFLATGDAGREVLLSELGPSGLMESMEDAR